MTARRDPGAAGRRVHLAGFGEVGSAFAARLVEAGATLSIADPHRAGLHEGLRVAAEAPAELDGVDLVLAATAAADAPPLAAATAGTRGGLLYVDLSSSAPDAMREAAARFDGARFVDGAIMGAVAMQGADVPIILAGPRAGEAEALMRALGLRARALPDSRPGDAVALKLLRSVLTKGLEAVALECFGAAEAMGMTAALRDNLGDIETRPFTAFVDAVVRTHPVHCLRRAEEVAAALDELERRGLPSGATRAARDAFRRSAARVRAEGAPAPGGATEAAAWFAGSPQ